MKKFARLPAIPLITQDPLVSVWAASDLMNDPHTIHWCGHKKPIKGTFTVDGKAYSFLSTASRVEFAETVRQEVTPLSTVWAVKADGVVCEVKFTSPFTPDDLDLASMPVTKAGRGCGVYRGFFIFGRPDKGCVKEELT